MKTSGITDIDRYIGCLLGGAVGDALGAPVEFMRLDDILRRFGSRGIRDYAPAYGRKGAITDDTQMTLFTAEGLILSRLRAGGQEDKSIPAFVHEAYLRWLATQEVVPQHRLVGRHGTCALVDGILSAYRELHSRRAPGKACLSALASGRMGTMDAPINKNSKGCGGVMRIAPVGLFLSREKVFDCACRIAAITHGHPTGFLAAGCLAEIIRHIAGGAALKKAVLLSRQTLAHRSGSGECLEAVDRALDKSETTTPSFECVSSLGRGWLAEEALAIGIYCALAGGSDFEKGICLAVNHGGDSDSTGAVTGNILGALLGAGAIPSRFTADLELRDLIEETATDLYERRWDG
jgi:ADP-ribosylglycohydrolase